MLSTVRAGDGQGKARWRPETGTGRGTETAGVSPSAISLPSQVPKYTLPSAPTAGEVRIDEPVGNDQRRVPVGSRQ